VREAFGDRAADGLRHRPLVDLVGTRRRNRDRPERQAERVRLRLQQLDSHGVHRHALRGLVDRRQQRAELDIGPVAQDVHHPRGVLPARPGDEALGHPGCGVGVSVRVASRVPPEVTLSRVVPTSTSSVPSRPRPPSPGHHAPSPARRPSAGAAGTAKSAERSQHERHPEAVSRSVVAVNLT